MWLLWLDESKLKWKEKQNEKLNIMLGDYGGPFENGLPPEDLL